MITEKICIEISHDFGNPLDDDQLEEIQLAILDLDKDYVVSVSVYKE